MFRLPQKIKNDLPRYKESLEKYLRGEITGSFFKGIRVPWGNYSHRGGKLFMARLRIPGGILTAKQLRAIGDASRRFAAGKLHITTRQDIQIHYVAPENLVKIDEYLHDLDISPRGGGGNTIRNVTGCYLSGICPYEEIEVYKYVWGITEYLLAFDEYYNLPRKFKIAFSGCRKDCAFVGVNDMGFIPQDGTGRFKVVCGGGMGAKSAVGRIIEDGIEPERVGYIVKAVINVFNKYGDRRNKHHNRLRFLISDLGWERFLELYRKELKRLEENEYITLRIEENGLPALEESEDPSDLPSTYERFKFNLGEQKQRGYFYFQIRIPEGELNAEQAIGLSELEKEIPYVIFRTTQRQNLVVSNIPKDKIPLVHRKVEELFEGYLYPETVLDIVTCKAATTCNLGICNAIAMTPEIEKGLRKANVDVERLKDVRININGCPNACGQHPIGTVSLSGLARKAYNKTVPCYRVHFGGEVEAERTRLVKDVGVVPAKAVPKLLVEYLSSGDLSKERLEGLVRKYAYIPPPEEDRSYYIDYGRTEEFSLEGLGQGECGAGVIDMIEADLESARQALIKAKEVGFEMGEIKDALIYSARALLVVKGVDPKSDEEAISAFIEKFIETGLSDPEFREIEAVYSRLTKGEIDGEEAYGFVEGFYREVKEIYRVMNPDFSFPVRFEAKEARVQREEKAREKILYDLRGTPCPINYVKAKVRLEGMEVGDILELYLDDGEPIRNVPKSLESDGQEILKIEQKEDFYRVVVRKKV